MSQPDRTLDAAFSPGSRFAALLPESLAAFRPVVAASVGFFLSRLPSPRREEIERRWDRLPAFAPSEVRLFELLRSCPTLHKLGQVLARERRLPPELRFQLQRLESMPAWTPAGVIREALGLELGEGVLAELRLGSEVLAEASVAVVVPFTWHSPGSERRTAGVFKILKPGVEERIEEELAIWKSLGAFLDATSERLGAPRVDYEGTIESVVDLLRAETRLDVEQAHLRSAAARFSSLPNVVIPEVLPFCTPRVTAMTRLPGRKVTDAADLPATTRRELARTITQALIVAPMLSPDPASSFHADPHAGNLTAADDGRLGILDWSLVGRLSSMHREQLAQIFLGAATRDAARIARAIAALSVGEVAESALRSIIDESLARLPWPRMPGMTWFLHLLDTSVLRARVRFDAELLLFRKALLMLEGVLADLEPAFDVDGAIRASVASQFAREWSARCFAHPMSRAFGTRLSNADLAEACITVSATMWNEWRGAWHAFPERIGA